MNEANHSFSGLLPDCPEAFHVRHSWRCWRFGMNDELHYILATLAVLRPHAESYSKWYVATNVTVNSKRDIVE